MVLASLHKLHINIKLTTRMAQIGKIEHFQIGEDWESYEEHLQQYFKANKITDADQKIAVFLTAVGSHLYKLLRNLVSPCKPAEVLWWAQHSIKAAPSTKSYSHSRKTEVLQMYSKAWWECLASLNKLAETCDLRPSLMKHWGIN